MNPKTEKLREERENNELKIKKYQAKLDQTNHQLQRAENRRKYLSKAERSKRTHHLCNLAGAMEHYFPVTKQMDGVDAMLVMEKLAELPEVQRLFASWHPKNPQTGGETPLPSTTSM